jgi:hypothetical protein
MIHENIKPALREYLEELAADVGHTCALVGSTPSDYDCFSECVSGLGRTTAYAIAKDSHDKAKGEYHG